MKQYTDPVFHETVRDFLVNQQFRRDYWVKGARRLTVAEQRERISQQRLLLISTRDTIELKVNGALGEAKLHESVYAPVLDHLADHRVCSFGDLLAELDAAHSGVTFPQLLQAVLVLIGAGHVVPVQDDGVIQACEERCKTCNSVIREYALSSNDISYNASCVTGGGIMIDRFSQLFLLARREGGQKPRDWAMYVWDILKSNGQLITKSGKALTTERENMDELEERAKKFAERLKIFEILKVAD